MNSIFRFAYRKFYLLLHPIKLFKEIKRINEAAWMRCAKGYCYSDIWNFYDWFLCVVPNMLDHLQKNHCGHPSGMTEEEWDNILKEMAQHLRNADEDNPLTERKNQFEEEYLKQFYKKPFDREVSEIDKSYFNAEKELNEWRQKEIEKAFDLMKKYFFVMWD